MKGFRPLCFVGSVTIGSMLKGTQGSKGQLMCNCIGWSEAEGKAVARHERCWSAASDGAGEGARL